MHQSLGQELKKLWSVSLIEAIACFVALCIFAGYAGWTLLNTDGIATMLVSEQAQRLQQNDSYIYAYEFINNSPLVATATVFVLWASLGLVISNIAYFVYASERSFVELIGIVRRGGKESHALLEEAAIRVGFRISAIVSLLVAGTLFTKYALPRIAVMLDGSLRTDAPTYLLSVVGVWLFLSLFVHFVVVMLRFVALKARLF